MIHAGTITVQKKEIEEEEKGKRRLEWINEGMEKLIPGTLGAPEVVTL